MRWVFQTCCGEGRPEADMSGLPGQCSFTDTLLSDISWASNFFPNRNLPHWCLHTFLFCMTS